MWSRSVVLVAFQEQDNLGTGYLASVLMQAGYRPVLLDMRLGEEILVAQIVARRPLLVGFSIIFQYHLEKFSELVRALRDRGCDGHFTAGGHYPSLQPRELLARVPGLDSVVLFEGEHTILELANALAADADWSNLRGTAARRDGEVLINPLRPLEQDLDRFPFPVRQPRRPEVLGQKSVTLLAGRGCRHDCTFCSIRRFYDTAGGPLKRLRDPAMVAEEIYQLHSEKNCSLFMFQDDDFPVSGRLSRQWALRFCELLDARGLCGKILWKISCRPDEIETSLFRAMKDAGLFLVYLGVESGTDVGLRQMNKQLTVEQTLTGVTMLKQLGIDYQFGFMLFDPSTTFESLEANLDFLERLCSDGSAPITFCKMLPYAGTAVEEQLRAEGRLKGEIDQRDYSFLNHALDDLYAVVADACDEWIAARDGVLNLARWAQIHSAVARRLSGDSPDRAKLATRIRSIVRDSNRLLIAALRDVIDAFARPTRPTPSEASSDVRRAIGRGNLRYCRQLTSAIHELEITSEPKAGAMMLR